MSKRSSLALVSALALFAAGGADAVTQGFDYTGAEQQFEVPPFVTSVSIKAFGAAGWSGAHSGGLGGEAEGTLAVTPGEILRLFVGGQGIAANGDHVVEGGGFNGGGDGQNNGNPNSVGGGGGASDVRQGGSDLEDRVLVAGGGGGSTDNDDGMGGIAFGGDGGGLVGADGGSCYPGSGGINGTGGTQVAGGVPGGALGQGGNADGTMTPWNGGGGGGYYGGGVAPAHCGGGGGSSYTGGVTGGSTTAGQRSGDGRIELTYEGCPPTPDVTCNGAGKSVLSLKDSAVAAKDKLSWKFSKSTNAIDKATELGDPVNGDTDYLFCIWDETASVPNLVAQMKVDSGGTCGTKPCWKETSGGAGVKFKSKPANGTGVASFAGKSGDAGKGSLGLVASGENLLMPTPIIPTRYFDQDPALVVELIAEDSGACWQSSFGADTAKKNTGEAFKAVAP